MTVKSQQPDFKQVFDFLNSIEGHGYGGMAEFEIARETVHRAVGAQHEKERETP